MDIFYIHMRNYVWWLCAQYVHKHTTTTKSRNEEYLKITDFRGIVLGPRKLFNKHRHNFFQFFPCVGQWRRSKHSSRAFLKQCTWRSNYRLNSSHSNVRRSYVCAGQIKYAAFEYDVGETDWEKGLPFALKCDTQHEFCGTMPGPTPFVCRLVVHALGWQPHFMHNLACVVLGNLVWAWNFADDPDPGIAKHHIHLLRWAVPSFACTQSGRLTAHKKHLVVLRLERACRVPLNIFSSQPHGHGI